jgi:hypothetical protein
MVCLHRRYSGWLSLRLSGTRQWSRLLGDFKGGIAKVKASVGAFDGGSATKSNSLIWAGRVQIDFWDPESGYYLNGTYYGDKNLLALGGASQVQSGKTATTVDFLMERKVLHGGAFTVESEYARYNGLASAIFRRIQNHTETMFGDSISSIEQSETAAHATFKSGRERDFDLVIGADGLHSGGCIRSAGL